MAESRRPCDDLAHLIRPNFVAAELEKFTGDVLNLAHAQTKSHQLGAESHQATAHQTGETTAIARGRDCGFRSRNPVNQGLYFIGGALVTEETQNDADGFFRDSIIDAGFSRQPRDQFVHIAPPSTGCVPAPACEFILILRDTNYKR